MQMLDHFIGRIRLSFILIQLGFMLAIIWAKETQPYSVTGPVMYSVIVFNFLVALLHLKVGASGKHKLILLALALTLMADYFLTLTDTYFELGIFLFCLVQLTYGWQIGYRLWNLGLRIGLFAVLAMVLHMLGMTFLISGLESCSISLLLGNVVSAFVVWYTSRRQQDLILALGLLLFAGCDLSLGIWLAIAGISELATLYHILGQLVWIFYVPAQALLTIRCISD